ncbi:MAG TPA: PAS domain S-box protein, partial [Gemmatimonadaceae bacterium]|nr:PAS domain S-box protein [Gemmatimonadaceae bacterium]
MRWLPIAHRTERLIALSQLACVATLAALLVPAGRSQPLLLNGTFTVSLAVFALAAAGIATHTQRLPRAAFAAFAAAAAMLVVAEAVAFVSPASALADALHTVGRTDKAILVATLNTLLPLYARATLAAQERAADALERSVVAERTFSSTLEARVALRTAELEDAQRVLQRMWRLGQQISLELDPTRVLERFVDAASDIAQADGAAIGLLSEDGTVRVPIARGALADIGGAHFPAAASAMGGVIRTGTPWVASGDRARAGTTRPIFPNVDVAVGSGAVLAISRRGERIGAVALVRQAAQPFTDVTLGRVNAMSDLLNVALENAELVETLRRAEWRFRTLFRSAPDAVFTVLRSGRIREANDAASDIIGVEPVRMVGRTLDEFVLPEDVGRLRKEL